MKVMSGESPQRKIGEYLKQKREHLNESLAEVSGAVEIDIDTLQRIELGAENPSEDILILLISHFGVDEPEARKVLQTAGYGDKDDRLQEDMLSKSILMLTPFMNQALYADDVDVQQTKNGVILTFVQPTSSGLMPVSRIGLSKDLANSLMAKLQNATNSQKAPKLLKASKKMKNENG